MVLRAGAGDSDSDGAIQMGVVNVQTGIIEVAASTHSNSIAVRNSQTLRTDAEHGVNSQGIEGMGGAGLTMARQASS